MSTLTMPGPTDAPVDRVTARRAHRLRALTEQGIARIVHELSVWRGGRHLALLDDRMLQDIGLRRTGIHYAARRGCDLVSLTPPNAAAAHRRGMEGE